MKAQPITYKDADRSPSEKRVLALLPYNYPTDVIRPRTRGDCLPGGHNACRPCGFVSCRYHLAVDVKPRSGNLVVRQDVEIEDMQESCALDVADRGGQSLEDVGEIMGVTRERVRQLEASALATIAPALRGYR